MVPRAREARELPDNVPLRHCRLLCQTDMSLCHTIIWMWRRMAEPAVRNSVIVGEEASSFGLELACFMPPDNMSLTYGSHATIATDRQRSRYSRLR